MSPPHDAPPAESRTPRTLLLEDGSELRIEQALPEDLRRIESFLAELGDGEVEEVAASLGRAPGELAGWLARPDRGETLLARVPGPDRTRAASDAREERSHLPGELAAVAAWRHSGDDGRTGRLTLAVAPPFRRRGLGTRLLERAGARAADAGVVRLEARVSRENEALSHLVRRGGFPLEEGEEAGERIVRVDLREASGGAGPVRDPGRTATASSLRPLFHPRTVAVVGASRDPGKVGHRIVRSLLDGRFRGTVAPVNPEADQVASVRAYPSVGDVPGGVDLAVLAVPAPAVPEVVDACAEAGAGAVVVVSAGFAETGAEGRQRQEELLERVRAHGMRMVGPNCLGLLSTDPEVRLNASFAPSMPPRGRAALCSQSGALGIAVIGRARRVGLGLSHFVSVGNKADVSAEDLLEYWEDEPATEVVLLYLESFASPRTLGRAARRLGRSTPVVMVKGGRTEAGERAAGSHTAALAGSEAAVDAFFRQTGIIRARSLGEMFDLGRFLSTQPLPPGRRVGIVTNAGGPGILCADALERSGLAVPTLPDELRGALAELLPEEASTGNPVDMVASAGPDEYRGAVELLLASGELDALVVIYTPVGLFDTDDVSRAVVEGWRSAVDGGAEGVPVLASVVGGEEEIRTLEGDGGSIPAYPFPEEIGPTLGRAADYRAWREEEPGTFPRFPDQELAAARRICRAALEERGPGRLPVARTRELLDAAGLRVAPGGVAGSPDEAVELAGELGYPVAATLASPEVAHKTEMGGVALELEDEEALRDAFARIRRRAGEADVAGSMEGVLVQPMFGEAAEVMLGVDPDPVFGAVVAVGLGGIHVEVLEDVAFRVAPLTDRDAHEAVRQIRGFRLLEGHRGHPEGDVEALEEALLRLSRLVEEVPEIGQVDLNPVFVLEPGQGYRVVDASVEVREVGEEAGGDGAGG